jgi:general L-amino acid transport system substrate-binding protein
MEAAFVTGNCTALAGDLTRLVNTRSEFGSIAGDYVLLPDVIAADPLTSATRSDDAGWSNVITWVNECLILAEDLGVTASTAQDNTLSAGEMAAKLLGRTHDLGAPLGLPDNWFLNVLNTTGNFGQIYDRAFGPSTNHALARGPNQSWTKGGLLYALPLK